MRCIAAAVLAATTLAPAPVTALGGAGVAAGHHGQPNLSPPLEPKEDKHFFHADYPHDLSPRMEDHWSHPFPIVQESKDYDKDFVKDENSDSGEWKYQNEYDTLRQRLAAARHANAQANARSKMADQDLATARQKEQAARDAAARAKKLKEEAEQEAKSVQRKAEERLEREMRKNVDGNDVNAQKKTVEQETKDVEDCQQQLAAARAKLSKLQAQKAEAEARQARLAAKNDQAQAKEFEKEKAEAALEEEMSLAQKEYERAHANYGSATERLARTEKEFAASEARLRQFRQQTDVNGGVYRVDSHGQKVDPATPSPPAKSGVRGMQFGLSSCLFVLLATFWLA